MKKNVSKLRWRDLALGNRSIRTRILVAFSIVLMFMLGLGISNYLTFTNTRDEVEKLVEEDIVIMQNYEKIAYYMSQRNVAIRSYLLTANSNNVGAYNNYSNWSGEHQEIILSHDDSQANHRIFKMISDWEDEVVSDILAPMVNQQVDEAVSNMHYINLKADSMQSEIITLSSARSAEMMLQAKDLIDRINQSIIYMVGILLAVVIISIIIAVLFAHSISRPIKRVATRLRTLATGILNQEALEIKGGGEVAELSQSANDLQTQLAEIIRNINESAEDLAQQSEELSQSASILASTMDVYQQRVPANMA